MENKNIVSFFLLTVIAIFISGLCFISYLINNELPKNIISKEYDINLVLNNVNYDLAIENIKKYEGLRLEPYQLPNDTFWYIGYGHQYPYKPDNISLHEADSLLNSDFHKRIIYVSKTYFLTGNKALAMAMLYYNVKPSAIRNSTFHNHLIEQKYNIIPNYDTSLIINSWTSFNMNNRRIYERRLFEVKLFFNL